MKKTIILAGDARQRILSEILFENGKEHDSAFSNEELDSLGGISGYSSVILPLPCTKDKVTLFSAQNTLSLPLSEIEMGIRPGALVIGGNMPKGFKQNLAERGADVLDYFKDESFTVYNAFLTAQGALRLLLENTQEFIAQKRILVSGFGRIGQALSKMLFSLGADVYVAARRKETVTKISALGLKAVDTQRLENSVYLFDYIFNTVPEKIFSRRSVLLMKNGAIYFELASSPFGAEKGDFEKSGADFVSGGALPGRFCPRSCAEAVFSRISKYI